MLRAIENWELKIIGNVLQINLRGTRRVAFLRPLQTKAAGLVAYISGIHFYNISCG